MKRTSMKKIKKVIELGENGSLSFREISRAVNLSRPVVTKYLTVFKSSGLTYDEIKDFKDEEIYELIIENPKDKRDNNERYAVLASKFEYLLKESKRKHVTLEKLWEDVTPPAAEPVVKAVPTPRGAARRKTSARARASR